MSVERYLVVAGVSGVLLFFCPTSRAQDQETAAPEPVLSGQPPEVISIDRLAALESIAEATYDEAELDRRLSIFDRPDTVAVLKGVVVETKAFLFENDDRYIGQRPQFEIMTRVRLEASRSYKSKYVGPVEFWSYCGQLDPEDWQSGKPAGCVLSIGTTFKPGDEVLVAIRDGSTLPDDRPALKLAGGRAGVGFFNAETVKECLLAGEIDKVLESKYQAFTK